MGVLGMRSVRPGAMLLGIGLLSTFPVASPPSPEPLAVFVHPDNPVRDLRFEELRSIFTLERQFWPERRRILLVLPRPGGPEHEALLDRVYRMSCDHLNKFWTGKVYAGEIPAGPATARTTERAVALVRASEGAVSVALAKDLPEGLPLVTIDGKKPGDPGYPLSTRATR